MRRVRTLTRCLERKCIKKCLISTSPSLSLPLATRRVSTLPLFRRSCESLQRHGVHSTPSCTLRHDTIRSADRLCHPTAFNLILLFLLLLLRRALYLVSVHLLLIYPCLHAWYTQEQRVHTYVRQTYDVHAELAALPSPARLQSFCGTHSRACKRSSSAHTRVNVHNDTTTIGRPCCPHPTANLFSRESLSPSCLRECTCVRMRART